MPNIHFLQDVLIFLIAAVVVVTAVRRLRVSPMVGYLVAGALIGPSGFAVITDIEAVAGLAELGIVFLMFTIGLEFSFARLYGMRRQVFGLGGLQVLVCGFMIGLAVKAAGVSNEAAFIIGAALALSSTAMVASLLRERSEVTSAVGNVAIAILLFQDLLVVPLLVLVPLLGADDSVLLQALGLAAVKAVVVLAVIVLLGRLVLRPLLRTVAAQRNPELLIALTLLIILGTSWMTERAGLSLALGAFLAGLLIAETEFRHQVEADIQPFRGILIGLFFMTVGMSMNLALAAENAPLLIAAIVALIVLKAVVIATLCRLFGCGPAVSVRDGLLLAQASEFSFVLFALAMTSGVIAPEIGQFVTLVIGASIALTPLITWIGSRLAKRIEHRGRGGDAGIGRDAATLHDHIVIAGFGRVGQIVGKLVAERGLEYIAFDLDPGLVDAARRRGLRVHYGDASNRNLLRAVGMERASVVIVTMDDHAGAMRTITALRQRFPDLPIFARGRDRQHCAMLRESGATGTVVEAMEAGLQLGVVVLRDLGIPENELDAAVDTLRGGDYAAFDDLIPPGGTRGDKTSRRSSGVKP